MDTLLIIGVAIFFAISLILMARNGDKERDKFYSLVKIFAKHKHSCKCGACEFVRDKIFH